MTIFRALLKRLISYSHRDHHDADLAAELESHLQFHIEDNLRAGMSPEEARRRALIKLGGLDQTKESVRARRGFPWLDSLLQDTRFALRMLRKNPGFNTVAVLTLALGIGATTSMFTIMDGVLLKPLQYPKADRIVAIDTQWTDSGKVLASTTGGDLQDLRRASCFAVFSYYFGGQFGVQLTHGADFGNIYFVDPDFFRVFDVPPSAGRTFVAQDAGRSAVISTEFAQRNFGSPSDALGHIVSIEGTTYEIVGVMPPLFRFPQPALVWTAASVIPRNQNRSGFNYRSVARLLPGISPKSASAQLLSISDRLAAAFPDTNRNKTFIAVPLQDQLAAPVRTTLFLLMGAVALVLLIACANVANLMLARATSRVREIAVRAVLGAGRWRIIAQLFSESVVLASAAAILGMGIAIWATKAVLVIGERFVPEPLRSRIQIDWRLLGFTILISLFTSILFGIAPAWQASRIDLHYAVKQSANRGVLGGGHSRLRNLLVIAQIAFSLTLAVCAGLLIRTLVALQHSQLGYRTEGILVTYISAPAKTLPDALRAVRLFDGLFPRLGKLPGAISAAGAMGLPAGQYNSDGSFAIEGKQSFSGDWRKLPYAGFRLASPNYFKTMGIPILSGRDFDDGDIYDRPFVTIISESLAKQNFPNEDPIGHRIECGLDLPVKWMTIIGVVGDIRQSSPAAQPGPEIYMPLQQHPFMATDLEVVVRTTGDPERLIPAVQKDIRNADPEIAMRFTTMRDLVTDSIGAQRFRTALASIFAVLAVLLALSGMYAVMSYVTAQRTSEFGLRSALGAQQGNLIRLVLRGAAGLAAVGTAIGILFSIATGRLLTSMLFGVTNLDPLTYTLVIALVLPIILLAAAIPAWRASRIDPMVALRHE